MADKNTAFGEIKKWWSEKGQNGLLKLQTYGIIFMKLRTKRKKLLKLLKEKLH